MNQAQFYCQAIKRLCNNKTLLPAEYQQVEYLQSSGYQLINIGSVKYHQYFRVDFEWASFVYNAPGITYNINGLLGTNGYSDQDVRIWLGVANKITAYIGATQIGTTNIVTGVKYKLYFSPTSFVLNNADYTTGSGTNASDINCYAFAVNSINAQNIWGSAVKIYRLKTSSIKLYPCYRKSDNKPGMYDLVTNTFFTNAGSGEFTVGNNV